MKKVDPNKKVKSLKELYPNLSEEELQEAERNLQAYAELVWKMYLRIMGDPQSANILRLLIEERKGDNGKHL